MNFLKLFLRSIALMPSLAQGVEGLYGAKTGAEKRAAVLEIAGAAIKLPEAVANKTVLDPAGFSEGLSMVVDGVVKCLNASIWSKQAAVASTAPGQEPGSYLGQAQTS